MDYDALTSDDFSTAVMASLPRGLAWPRDPNTIQAKVWSVVAQILWLLHQAIVQLFNVETDPSQTQQMLPDWQKAYGITPRGTEDDQRTHLVTVITDPGGSSAAHYVALAARLGITINPVRTAAFTWAVHAAAALSVDERGALEDLINAQNRVTCIVSFVYDL